MTPRELDTVLAALRFWQARNLPRTLAGQRMMMEHIAKQHGPALDAEEIDALCQRLNLGAKTDAGLLEALKDMMATAQALAGDDRHKILDQSERKARAAIRKAGGAK